MLSIKNRLSVAAQNLKQNMRKMVGLYNFLQIIPANIRNGIDTRSLYWYNGIITNWYYQKGDIYEITRH